MPKQISYAEACDNFEQVYGKALSGKSRSREKAEN